MMNALKLRIAHEIAQLDLIRAQNKLAVFEAHANIAALRTEEARLILEDARVMAQKAEEGAREAAQEAFRQEWNLPV